MTLLMGLFAEPGAAQDPLDGGVEAWIERANSFRSPHAPDSALASLEAGLVADPEAYALLWRANREALSYAMLEEDAEARKEGFARAVAYGERAIEANPDGLEGRAWLAAALGRYALDQGPRTRVQLANRIFALASQVVDADPGNGVAQHVLGQWHAEVLRSGRITRFIARRLLGGDSFEHASWERAVHHLQASVEAEPWALIHGLELARVYLDLERTEEARQELDRVLALPDTEATDPQHRRRARELRSGLGPPLELPE